MKGCGMDMRSSFEADSDPYSCQLENKIFVVGVHSHFILIKRLYDSFEGEIKMVKLDKKNSEAYKSNKMNALHTKDKDTIRYMYYVLHPFDYADICIA